MTAIGCSLRHAWGRNALERDVIRRGLLSRRNTANCAFRCNARCSQAGYLPLRTEGLTHDESRKYLEFGVQSDRTVAYSDVTG
jgi:hypothetical protein